MPDTTPPVLWRPSPNMIAQSQLRQYQRWLTDQYRLTFVDYDALWSWSVHDTQAFWQSIWSYFCVLAHTPPTAVHTDAPMPATEWFPGATLNYAEHIFRQATDAHPAIVFRSERHELVEISWAELADRVARLAEWLREQGIVPGDRVVAYLPNIPEATIAFLAVNSLGAVWSSCSPDFGSDSVQDRFAQIEPKLLLTVDGYQYNGKPYGKRAVVEEIVEKLPTLEGVVLIPYLANEEALVDFLPDATRWSTILSSPTAPLVFTPVPFSHPIWVLYSSGTTGIPKAITHSHGGVLLEHLKYLAFHNDVRPGERFFWFSTTGWMMWNMVQASLLLGATVVLYDGSPTYPDFSALWAFAEQVGIHHFGTSAPYLVACMKQELDPQNQFDLSAMRSLSSTGAPLPPEAFDWVYEHVKSDVWLCSMSGGTDVCTAFVGGVPTVPVYKGEIQRRALGCALYAYDESGEPVTDEVGEMVITKPMPSMPIYFWNDPERQRYLASYFEMYPNGIWRHGDWLRVTPRQTLVILGRSDATLNRHGIRIGTAEIYRALHPIEAIQDSLIINLELPGGEHYMPLFITLADPVDPAQPGGGHTLNDDLIGTIKKTLRQAYSPRHVPDEVRVVPDIPYTISGKKLEAPVKKILLGMAVDKAANRGAMRNPEALDYFIEMARELAERRGG